MNNIYAENNQQPIDTTHTSVCKGYFFLVSEEGGVYFWDDHNEEWIPSIMGVVDLLKI